MTEVFFQNRELLWLLLLLPALALLRGRRGRAAAVHFPSIAIAKSASKQAKVGAGKLLFYLRLIALALLIVALARPQIGRGYSEVESSGIDIVLAVDVSGSMYALDFSDGNEAVTRLDVVKDVVRDFIENRPGDRIGLVAFSRDSFLVSPLSLNHDWLTQNVDRLEIGIIDSSATAIGPAIGMSVNRLRDIPAKSKIVILLTDGEDNVNKLPPLAAAEAAAALDVKVYTIAVGRPGRVPFPRVSPDGQIVRDRAGRVVIAGYMEDPIDEETLAEIANITHARSYRATDRNELAQIYSEIDRLEKSEVRLRHFAEYVELFQWLAVSALLVFLLEQILFQTLYRRLP